MKAMALLLVACAACSGNGDDFEQYPVVPGGGASGGTSGGGGSGSGSGSGSGGETITGRVCKISDARSPIAGCASTGADGLTVLVRNTSITATTAADGSFTIAKPTTTTWEWRVAGPGIVDSLASSMTGNTIPALSDTTYTNMLAQAQVTAASNAGTIIAVVRHNGALVTGATAATTPPPAGQVFYDGADATTWTTTSTSGAGVVWVPNVDTGTATLTISGAQTGSVTGIPILTSTITWLFADI